MSGLRRINFRPSSQRSAEMARERLLNDRQIHRNRNFHADGLPLPSDPFSGLPATGPFSPAFAQNLLTSSEQKRQAIQIAQTFRQHYLAVITYHEDCRVVVATVRPIHARNYRRDVAHDIHVDPAGNVNIVQCPPEHSPQRWLALGRLLMVASIVVTLFGSLLGALSLFF